MIEAMQTQVDVLAVAGQKRQNDAAAAMLLAAVAGAASVLLNLNLGLLPPPWPLDELAGGWPAVKMATMERVLQLQTPLLLLRWELELTMLADDADSSNQRAMREVAVLVSIGQELLSR